MCIEVNKVNIANEVNKATNCLRDTVSSLSPILKNRETPKYTGVLGNLTELMRKKHKYKSIEH